MSRTCLGRHPRLVPKPAGNQDGQRTSMANGGALTEGMPRFRVFSTSALNIKWRKALGSYCTAGDLAVANGLCTKNYKEFYVGNFHERLPWMLPPTSSASGSRITFGRISASFCHLLGIK